MKLTALLSVCVTVLIARQTPSTPANVRTLAQTIGPLPSIVCPAGAIAIQPGASIQAAVNAAAAGASFCLKAGTHSIAGAITPKSGDTFVGEYGAVLDGSGWTTSVDYAAAIMAHNQDIDNVTIRNLVIRNMPQRGIHAFRDFSDHWTIENNEVTGCRSGIGVPSSSSVRHNYIHHNGGDSQGGLIPNGGYIASQVADTVFEDNEIAYNGPIEKIVQSRNVSFRNNYVHHNQGTGIWYDGDNTGSMIEGNRIEDNGLHGIHYEVSGRGVIRDNVVKRSADSAIFLSTSRDVEVTGNLLDGNFRGLNLFVSCAALAETYSGALPRDLSDNSVHDNAVIVGTRTGAIAALLGASGDCSSSQVSVYTNGSKANTFARNRYVVPDPAGRFWFWQALRTWPQWQALDLDTTGSVR
jgi:parallel beta-helix repeat protein